jgi:hypothetical protein
MFALIHRARIEELYLTGGLSYKSLKEHEIARNGDMIDFCTTTYSSISNRVFSKQLLFWKLCSAHQTSCFDRSIALRCVTLLFSNNLMHFSWTCIDYRSTFTFLESTCAFLHCVLPLIYCDKSRYSIKIIISEVLGCRNWSSLPSITWRCSSTNLRTFQCLTETRRHSLSLELLPEIEFQSCCFPLTRICVLYEKVHGQAHYNEPNVHPYPKTSSAYGWFPEATSLRLPRYRLLLSNQLLFPDRSPVSLRSRAPLL